MKNTIQNPILPGFNPDPSICRVGDDYYIATSTFEWFPGVQIHHSKDLVNWELITRPLNRASQLDMRGNPDSCGIWAPCLSYADGLFWLIYTDMKRYEGNFKDGHNYLVTAPSITGPWSDPVYLNSSGFDPSLFHDEDGRKWLINLQWDYRQREGGDRFGGILLQEYDVERQQLVGPIKNIFAGTELKLTEGSHLYRRDGWYHLLVAEGGTGYDHAVTMARSRNIEGPYEVHPQNPVLTSKHDPDCPLQRAGHADIVETPNGETFMVHLCGRPLPGTRRSPRGRETAIQRVEWGSDGWLRLADGGNTPSLEIAMPGVEFIPPAEEEIHTFATDALPMEFQWLRTPHPERIFSLTERPGYLRLFGRESVGSWFEQALVARRQDSIYCSAETVLSFEPEDIQQFAGLTAYYNRFKYHFLAVTLNDNGEKVLSVMSCADEWPSGSMTISDTGSDVGNVVLAPELPVSLGLDIREGELQFRFRQGEAEWQTIGPVLDAGLLSDEGSGRAHGYFTGNFLGMAAYDISGRGTPADFAEFRYRRLNELHR